MASPDYTESIMKAMAIPACMTATDARLWLAHRYETDFGIYNHESTIALDRSPMPEIKLHPAEDLDTHSRLTIRLQQYLESGVLRSTGIPFDRFLELPTEWCLKLIDASRRNIVKDDALVSDILSQYSANAKKP